MANRKKEVYKPKPMTEGKRNLIQGLLQEYDIQSAEDIQDALKDLLSGTIQDMLETEMDNHLGYDRYERSGEQDHFHVCEGNDHTTDFKDYRGYLWF